ncbi:uncharacterized protein PRCAT00004290001 [Priceomyces carsonii]|uniref:uncharacterized protein n=1 Tax=Priceomyces carsonii TaxID=28549 RepID=UPI002ED9A734|nr:unnamed protein product [Priceomyces carsonii]
MQVILFAGGIGTGLFVGTGATLSTCGPAPLVMAFCVTNFFLWSLMNQLGEMVSFIPLNGETTLYALSRRYASKSLSFVAGWNLFYAQAIIAPAEITACAFVIQYWTDLNPAIFITIFLVPTIAVNLLPAKYFGEAEFWVASIKIICLIGLIIVGIVIFFGGAPNLHGVLGFHYWKDPGSFTNSLFSGNLGRFLSFWSALVKSGFSFILVPELLTSFASEVKYPRENMPKACSKFFYRLLIFFTVAPLVISVIVASNDSRLMDAVTSGKSSAAASPFVIGIQNAGIPVLNHIINACILTSALSCGNSFLFASSRVLHSLALKGDAPKIFSRTTRSGVPIYAVSLLSLIALLAYLNCSNSASTVFNWLTNIATISGFISWIFVSITYIRYRKVISFLGLDDRVPFRTRFMYPIAFVTMTFFTILCLTNGYTVFIRGNWNVSNFVAAYISIPIVIVLYVGGRALKRERENFYDPVTVDVLSDLEEVETSCTEKEPKRNKIVSWLL